MVVAGHAVAFDPERKLCYCDVQVYLGMSYWPFVRLALARYQPNSIDTPSVHLSRVVTADFAQVAPNRFVTITGRPPVPSPSPDQTPTQARRRVSVLGVSYEATPAGDPVKIDHGPTEMRVIVERRDDSIGGELGWTEVGSPTVLAVGAPVFGQTSWSGDITFPALNLSGRFRLVIEEHEVRRGDGYPFGAISPDPTNPGPFRAPAHAGWCSATCSRL